MKIEVLYFEGCPNHRLAVERVKEVLKQEGLRADISKANVPNAARAQAVGSSRVDRATRLGEDVL